PRGAMADIGNCSGALRRGPGDDAAHGVVGVVHEPVDGAGDGARAGHVARSRGNHRSGRTLPSTSRGRTELVTHHVRIEQSTPLPPSFLTTTAPSTVISQWKLGVPGSGPVFAITVAHSSGFARSSS